MYCGGELPELTAPPPTDDAPPAAPAPELDDAARALLQQLEDRATPAPKPSLLSRFGRKKSTPAAPRPAPRAPSPPTKPGGPTLSARRAPEPVPKKGKRGKKGGASTITLLADAPPPPSTYAEALVRGGGPFGNRESKARVVLFPHPTYKPKIAWLKHRLVNTLGVDLYTAVQALQRDVPRALAFLEDEAEAHRAVEHLREGGLFAGVLLRSRIAAWGGPEEVVAMTHKDADTVAFRLREGGEEAILRSTIRTAVLGRIEPDAQERSGGALGRTGGPYTAIDLLIRGRDRPVRVRSDLFDFRSVGEHVGISALVNLKSLAAELGPGGGPVPLDERFKRVPHFAALARAADAAEPPPFLRRELEFAEYGLILDLAVP